MQKTLNLTTVISIFLAGAFITTMGDTIIGPVFPPEALSRGIDQLTIGVCMGLHPLFTLLSSFWMGKFMIAVGRKKIMVLGSLL